MHYLSAPVVRPVLHVCIFTCLYVALPISTLVIPVSTLCPYWYPSPYCIRIDICLQIVSVLISVSILYPYWYLSPNCIRIDTRLHIVSVLISVSILYPYWYLSPNCTRFDIRLQKLYYSTHCTRKRYTSQVTLHKSDKFWGNLLRISANCLAVNRVHLYRACSTSLPCSWNIHTMSAEHPCSVCESATMFDLHSLHTRICQSCETMYVLTQMQRKIPNDSQVANRSRKEDQGFQVTNRSREVVLPLRKWKKWQAAYETITIDTSHKKTIDFQVANLSHSEEETQRFVIIASTRKWHQAPWYFADSSWRFWRPFIGVHR